MEGGMVGPGSRVRSCLLLLLLCSVSSTRNATRRHKSPGRHVCIENKVVTKPIKEMESYCKPIYKSQMHPCEKDKNKFCTSFRVTYEKAFRTVYKITATKEEHVTCCPGWARAHPKAHGCNKPVCSQSCLNGGTCFKPDHCLCPVGWTGKFCQQDVNECKTEGLNVSAANCTQRCVNTRGSYRCECHEGFSLEPDGRNCRISINQIPELQEFVQGYEELTRKLQELEMSRQNLSDLYQRLDDLSKELLSLREEMQSTTSPAPTTGTEAPPPVSTPDDVSPALTTPEDSRYGSPWDRINSLSEQISMLEERLDDCTCDHLDGSQNIPPPVK